MPLLRLRSGRHAQDEARPELTAGTSGAVTTEGDGTRSASHACPLHPPGSLRTMRRRHATEPSPPCQRTEPAQRAGSREGFRPTQGQSLNQRRHHQGGGGGERDRTDDLLLAKQALSQLSYAPKPDASPFDASPAADQAMVGRAGFEPATPRLSSVCSDQLSYQPPRHPAWPIARHRTPQPRRCRPQHTLMREGSGEGIRWRRRTSARRTGKPVRDDDEGEPPWSDVSVRHDSIP